MTPSTYPDTFLGHLTLALEWMAISLGLWGYPRVMSADWHERLPDGSDTSRG